MLREDRLNIADKVGLSLRGGWQFSRINLLGQRTGCDHCKERKRQFAPYGPANLSRGRCHKFWFDVMAGKVFQPLFIGRIGFAACVIV